MTKLGKGGKRHAKKNKKVISGCLCAGVILSMGVTAYAATVAETAYVYGFDYGDHVNTTAIVAQEQMYLNNLGYQTYCNTDVTASFAVGDSPSTGVSRMNSGVFAFNGHAGPGSCQFADASNGNDTFLTAKKSGTSGTYTYSKFESVDMSNCKVAFFFGCKTASTERESTYGVLTTQSIISMPLTVCEVPDYVVSDTLTDDGVMFTKTSDSTIFDVLCKIDNEIKLVRIIKTEYASENNETYQLNTKCFDMETGAEIDYMDIVNQLMK